MSLSEPFSVNSSRGFKAWVDGVFGAYYNNIE